MEHIHHTSTGIDSRKIAMWIVIASECMLFGTLIINYVIQTYKLKVSNIAEAITPHNIINVPITSISTFVLLMSSLTMVLCLNGIEQDNLKKFRFWCFATATLGAIFLGFQIYEFSIFYLEGLGLTTNLFGSAFFSLTSTHGAHVLVGIIILVTAGIASYNNKISGKKQSIVIETIGLYWHFVDVIWILIFTIVYLFVLAP